MEEHILDTHATNFLSQAATDVKFSVIFKKLTEFKDSLEF
jgi:hypothetical protein